jgi:hypothetical protein
MPELTRLRGGDDIARPADNNTGVVVRAYVMTVTFELAIDGFGDRGLGDVNVRERCTIFRTGLLLQTCLL